MVNNQEIITYSLRDDQADAAQYYRDVAALTDEVVRETGQRLQPLLDDFDRFLGKYGSSTQRTHIECVFELLTLGVLWKIYIGNALALSRAAYPLLAGLSRLREKGGRIKKAADRMRRATNTLLFDHRRTALPLDQLRLEHLVRLVHWLEASGDYSPQVRRLQDWQAYFVAYPEGAPQTLAIVVSLADWFASRSLAVLGCYTRQVEHYLAEAQPSRRWHEDVITCGRPRLEYHLNMVGNELLNRAYRPGFLTALHKAVVVPPCMRAQPDDLCLARPTPFGLRCIFCTPECRVNALTRLGEQHGFEVYILPEDLRVFSADKVSEPRRDSKAGAPGAVKVGIVGVSCVLTNAPGGCDARKNGILAQGVPLDYCGCCYHWRDPRLPTDVDFERILQVLDIRS